MMYVYGLEYYWISKHQRDTNGKEALTSTKCTCVCMLFFFFFCPYPVHAYICSSLRIPKYQNCHPREFLLKLEMQHTCVKYKKLGTPLDCLTAFL